MASQTHHETPALPVSGLDRYILREVGQVIRALQANGHCTEDELAVLVGALYWERNRYQRVLEFMKSDGLITQDASGRLRLPR